MKPEERLKYLSRLGKHEQYGVAIIEWLKEESDKMNVLKNVDDWEEALKRKSGMEFIRKLLGLLERQGGNITKKTDYK